MTTLPGTERVTEDCVRVGEERRNKHWRLGYLCSKVTGEDGKASYGSNL